MTRLRDWFGQHINSHITRPLFDEQGLVVFTALYRSALVLKRHPSFDQLMISTVENGLQRDDWRGFVYIMHWQHSDGVVPLYIGKAERKGRIHALSYNLKNIRSNDQAFGRWGYGLDYHIGDLSHVLFGWEAYKNPDKKYQLWAERLFVSYEPPVLLERVYVAIISWQDGMCGPSGLPGSVPAVEKELIALAASAPGSVLLNRDGT